MELVNLTPHAVTFYGEDGNVLFAVEPSGVVARCTERATKVGEINGIPVVSKSFGEIYDLPEAKEGTIYIVSLIVALAAKASGRDDLRIVADPVRNEKGQIIGCRSLCIA